MLLSHDALTNEFGDKKIVQKCGRISCTTCITMYNVPDPSLTMRVKLERGLFGGGLNKALNRYPKIDLKSENLKV